CQAAYRRAAPISCPAAFADWGGGGTFTKSPRKPASPGSSGRKGRQRFLGCPAIRAAPSRAFRCFLGRPVGVCAGVPEPGRAWVRAELTEDYVYKTDRPTYHPAWLETGDDGWRVRIVPWFGSSDLRGLMGANALVLLDPGEQHHAAGSKYRVLRIEN